MVVDDDPTGTLPTVVDRADVDRLASSVQAVAADITNAVPTIATARRHSVCDGDLSWTTV